MLAILLVTIMLLPTIYVTLGAGPAIIYLLIWIDKMALGFLKPIRYVGIELTTLAGVLAGVFYGATAGFVSMLTLFTVFQSLRYMIFPILEHNHPPFIPSKDAVIAAFGGALAGVLASFSFSLVLMSVVVAENLVYVGIDTMTKSHTGITALIGGILFYAAVIVPISPYFTKFFI